MITGLGKRIFVTRTFVAFCAAVGAGSVATLVLGSHNSWTSGLGIFAVVWVMFAVHPLLSETIEFSYRSVFGAIIGGAFACPLAFVGESWRTGTLVVSFPIPLLFTLCEPSCRTPWSKIVFTPAAMIAFYVVLVFGPVEEMAASRIALSMVAVIAVGSGFAVLTHLVFSIMFQRGASFCSSEAERTLRQCLAALLYLVEGSLAYMTTGETHLGELQNRLKRLNSYIDEFDLAVLNWQSEPWSDKPSRDALVAVQNLLVNASAQQLTLLETIAGGYSPEAKSYIWNAQCADKIEDLRLCSIAALRLICRQADGENVSLDSIEQFVSKASSTAKEFKISQGEYMVQRLKSDNTKRHLSRDEALRAFYAQYALRGLAILVGDLSKALNEADISSFASSWCDQLCCNTASAFQDIVVRLFTSSEYFKAGPVDATLDGRLEVPLRTRAFRLAKYPFRFALCCHIAAVSLVSMRPWLKEFPGDASKYTFWALLPCLLCFLPTTGAIILKSSRRVLGTIVGGLLSLGCLWWCPGNKEAFLMQCVIITFLAKYSSLSAKIGYGGITFGLTWQIVVLGTLKSGDSISFSDAANIAGWRIGFTFGGCVFAVVCSLLLFPEHATHAFEKDIAEALICTTELAALNMESCLGIDMSPQNTGSNLADQSSYQLESAVRLGVKRRFALLVESEAEAWLIGRRVQDLAILQTTSVSLLSLSVSIRSLSSSETVHENEAAQRFLADATEHGHKLRQSIAQACYSLRSNSLNLALFLQGIRAPSTRKGLRHITKACEELQRSFESSRAVLYEGGQIASLVPLDLDRFYSQIHGLLQYGSKWIALEEHLLKEQTNEQGAMPLSKFNGVVVSDFRSVDDQESELIGKGAANGKRLNAITSL